MPALTPPVCDFGWPAPDFALMGVDGREHTLSTVAGPKGLLVMFICNHCPFVQAVIERIVRDCTELDKLGVGSIAIMPNDIVAFPQDGWGPMREWSQRFKFPFPYVMDEDQSVARAYGAQCTPDFFGFNGDLKLQYRGRLDASGRAPVAADAPRELFEAMRLVAASGQGPREQVASIGCSIKWKEG